MRDSLRFMRDSLRFVRDSASFCARLVHNLCATRFVKGATRFVLCATRFVKGASCRLLRRADRFCKDPSAVPGSRPVPEHHPGSDQPGLAERSAGSACLPKEPHAQRSWHLQRSRPAQPEASVTRSVVDLVSPTTSGSARIAQPTSYVPLFLPSHPRPTSHTPCAHTFRQRESLDGR